MTINIDEGPYPPEDHRDDETHDAIPDTPQDPNDTRDPGDAEGPLPIIGSRLVRSTRDMTSL